MTIKEFQHVVFRLSNTCFVRHWMNWKERSEPPYYMAFTLIDWEGQPLQPYLGDLERYGPHTIESIGVNTIYIFERTE
ncbi:hypothetical protein [Hymenobacter glacieicola]|uniref:Uncharacterized protein n=1 Tax=Hymenobacter glacieicola TaxID=1562124 RepID=A0ABQ1XA78_9BACT|nr:hypothetical protein [Hymenobacter glacieicola]GGG61426.1 hypothetical protein GCM10011378_41830 [Hymenobacter glacieicola]